MSTQTHAAEPPTPHGKMKPVACRKCHSRKIKCPGGKPCKPCVQIDCQAECVYPKRDRQVRVPESYLNSILQQNRDLRTRVQSFHSEEAALQEHINPTSNDHMRVPVPPNEPSHNPLLEAPWFVQASSFNVPLRVGEGADTAFATRFRQSVSQTPVNHPARIQYPSDEQISSLSEEQIPKLSSTHARFLVQAALSNIDKCHHHITRSSSIWGLLNIFIADAKALDMSAKCKIYAILALGELYSSHYKDPDTVTPGLQYFSLAFKLYGVLSERPSPDNVEVMLLLCLYSLCINRWHSAYFLASSAIRQCAVMGLQFNIPEMYLKDNAAREHLRRVWWTAYILEYTCTINIGQMVLMGDDEILVDLPSNRDLSDSERSDFQDPGCMSATIRLVKLSRKTVNSLYGRGRQNESFIQQVQSGMRRLKQWAQSLPEDLKIDSQQRDARLEHIHPLHLLFNQCIILTTRPILLYMVRQRQRADQVDPSSAPTQDSEPLHTLREACVQTARHSQIILTQSWINGTFKPFSYTRIQYLFSAAMILGISSFLGGPTSPRDLDDFELACRLMESLVKSGSLVAAEFYKHIEALKTAVIHARTEESSVGNRPIEHDIHGSRSPLQVPTIPTEAYPLTVPPAVDMFLSEPCLGSFLSQNELGLDDVCYLNASQPEGLYWPEFDSI